MKKHLFLLTLILAPLAHAMKPANPADVNMPVMAIALGQEYKFKVSEEGLHLVVELGHLEPGWYGLIESGLDRLVKETNRYLPYENKGSLLGFYVKEGCKEGHRYAKVSEAGKYSLVTNLRSRENQLREFPTSTFDLGSFSNYGSPIEADQFAGYPDCQFIRDIAPADELIQAKFQLEQVDESAVPSKVREYINAL